MALKTIPKRDPALIFGPDNSNDGPCGWTGLLNGTTPQGIVLPSPMPSIGGGGFMISTEDGGASYNPDNYAMAIKRLTLPLDATYVSFDFWMAIAAYHQNANYWTGPRAIDIGLDTGWGTATDGSDNRTFYGVRYLLIDEAATGPNQRWQIKSGNDSAVNYVDFPGQPTYPIGWNENKVNLFHLRMMCNIVTRKVSGFSVNGLGYGRLAATPDASLETAATPFTGKLVQGGAASFYGGMNFCVEVYNRNNIATSKSKVYFAQPMGEKS